MKNIYEVLRHKEQQSEQLQKEIDALRIAIKILDASEVPTTTANTNGNGVTAEPVAVTSATPAKRFP